MSEDLIPRHRCSYVPWGTDATDAIRRQGLRWCRKDTVEGVYVSEVEERECISEDFQCSLLKRRRSFAC